MPVPIPLLSGAYNSPAYIAGAQRCVNLYPELNPKEIQSQSGPFVPAIPFTHRLTPGLSRLFTFPDGTTVRGLFTASNGDLYGVCGQSFYYIDPDYSLFRLGYITPGTNQCKFADNGISGVLVDGSGTGYQVNLATRTMNGIASSNASGTNGYGFQGGVWVDEADGFIFCNRPGTAIWNASANYQIVFDALSEARKSGTPDPIQILAALHRYVWLVGTQSAEIWYNAGGTNFPYAIVSGPFIEHGACAPYSGAKLDESLFWLAGDKRGFGIAVEGHAGNFTVDRVSTHAIEQEWKTYPTLSDAVGMSYQDGGHSFYVLRFPTADKTWAYDRMTLQWHERVSFDTSMNEHQWRVTCITNAYGKLFGGDFENGKVYEISSEIFSDDGQPIQRRRGFPHIMNALKRVQQQQFVLDIECGNTLQEYPGPLNLFIDPQSPIIGLYTDGPDSVPILLDPLTPLYDFGAPQVNLRWSDTRGKSWNNPVPRSLGQAGAYNVSPSWRKLGIGRDRVYEIFWTSPEVTALNGAFLEPVAGLT